MSQISWRHIWTKYKMFIPKAQSRLQRICIGKLAGNITSLLEESAPCCILNPSNLIQKALFAVDPSQNTKAVMGVAVLLLYEECLEAAGAGLVPVQGKERAEPSLPAGAGAAPGLQQPRPCQGHGLLALLSLGMRGSSAVTGIKVPPCSSHTCPLGSPNRDRPGFTSGWVGKVWWRTKGVAVTYPHTVERNFLLAEFSLSLDLGENLEDIWPHWNHLVLSCWSVSTWKRRICWKISAFGTSRSLRWCVVETSDTETQGAWKGCFLDWHPKLRCWRRLGRALGWGAGRVCENRVALTAAR